MIPLKSNELLCKIMKDHEFSVAGVAVKLGVSRRSVHRLLSGEKASGKLVVALIRLYLELNPETRVSTDP